MYAIPWQLRQERICLQWGRTQLGISGLGRSPGEGNGNPLHYSCLGNPMDRGAWCAMVHGVAKELDTTELLIHMYIKLSFHVSAHLDTS